MKVLLINPSLILAEIGHYSKSIEKQRGIYPPLGIAYIASSLIHAGHTVKLIDCDTEDDYWKKIEEICKSFKPEIVGFYAMTWNFSHAKKILGMIRRLLPDVISIIGGPNVTALPIETLEIGGFDFGIKSEGEKAIVALLECIDGKKSPEKIGNLVYRKNGAIIENPVGEYIKDLDEIYFPAWELLPVYKYFDVFTVEKKFVTIFVSRGCPFKCTFCDRLNRMGRKWRVRSVENVIKEISFLQSSYNIKEFMFFDDNFILNKNWIMEFCEAVKPLDIIWECRTRVDTVNRDILKKMKQAGCYRIRYGMESGDNEILKVIKKDITTEQIKKCSKITKEEGIENFSYFMLGMPNETPETIEKTIKLAIEIDPEFVLFSKLILIPGSEVFDWAVENNHIDNEYWIRYLKGEETNSAPSISTELLPEKVLDKYVSRANKQFYGRPKYMLKRLLKVKSFYQFTKQLEMGKTILFK